MKPMLADSIDATKLERYINDDAWWMQQKLDGHRVLIRVVDGVVTPLGRDGEPKANAIPAPIRAEFTAMSAGEWYFDGELVGTKLWLFDLPFVAGHVAPTDPYSFRHDVLSKFFAGWSPGPSVRLLSTAVSTLDKAELCRATLATGREGVIVKESSAPYRSGPGRSSYTLKAKYVKTADVVVKRTGVGGKENCEFFVYDNGVERPVGGCSLLGKPAVNEGDVIEVRYLYANDPAKPKLYQPSLLRVRTDKAAHECTIDQLLFTDKSVMETTP